jgi:hypothetical protein
VVSTSQSSDFKDSEFADRGRKKGHSIMYAHVRERKGRTRRVPSFGPALDMDVQPCHGRKIEHWFLQNDGKSMYFWLKNESVRCVIKILVGVNPGSHVEGIVIPPGRPSLEDFW